MSSRIRTILTIGLSIFFLPGYKAAAPITMPTSMPPSTQPALPTSTPTLLPPLAGSGGGVIAFTSERDGSMEIYVMNADGSDQRRLTSDSGDDGRPTWAPAGTRLAHHSVQPNGSTLEWVKLYNSPSGQWDIPLHGNLWEPAWSHDGQRLAFSVQTSDSESDIYVQSIEGEQLTQLTNTAGIDGGPFWSPDDQQIVFYSNRDGNIEVYEMLADGSDQRRLTDSPAEDVPTAWSPDGTQLAFSSDREGNYELYSMHADGTDLQRLTNTPSDEKDPAWSPDGKRFAFISNRDGNYEIYIAPVPAAGSLIDDGSMLRLTDAPGSDMLPAWMPVP